MDDWLGEPGHPMRELFRKLKRGRLSEGGEGSEGGVVGQKVRVEGTNVERE